MKRTALGAMIGILATGCPSPERTVGGTVTGLEGTLVLKMGPQSLNILQDGPYQFSDALGEGASYEVEIQSQPSDQECVLANATGVMANAAVTNANVTCQGFDPNALFSVQVQVSGLSGTMVLLNNGGDPLTVSSNGTHTFSAQVNGGGSYDVTVGTQPDDQACTVQNGSGRIFNDNITDIVVTCGEGYSLSGIVTYDLVSPEVSGGAHLDYPSKVALPVRRAVVRAVDAVSSAILAEQRTKDDGSYSVKVPLGSTVRIHVQARIQASGYSPDGLGPNECNGATWEAKIVDNTQSRALYVLQSTGTYSAGSTSAHLHAPLTLSGTSYLARTAAPFALLDTVVTVIEKICEADPNVSLPLLNVNWSVLNTPADDGSAGAIGTSYYTTNLVAGVNTSEVFILGKEDIDTDEYDSHVIAHEVGHYIEDRLYRSDSAGGSHQLDDVLMPSVAFSEGFGNAFSGMVFNDPVYVDTTSTDQASGFSLDVSDAPVTNDRGVYSEGSVQFFLWSLYENRDVTPLSGSIERIHTVLAQDVVPSAALTSLHLFAALYKARFGDVDSLQGLWETQLATPWNALCVGACLGVGDTADLFDLDNDIGLAYAATRVYPEDGSSYTAPFWSLYRNLSAGTQIATAHDVTDDGSYGSRRSNKWGYVRAYRLVGTGNTATVSVSNLGTGVCTTDFLDLWVFQPVTSESDRIVTADTSGGGSTAGCPVVTFPTVLGVEYVLLILGQSGEVPSWNMVVSL